MRAHPTVVTAVQIWSGTDGLELAVLLSRQRDACELPVGLRVDRRKRIDDTG